MVAPTKAYTAILDSQIDPDSPIDTALMTAIRDDLVHLREWLGASYVAGAVQDHNHDGLNSASIPIGPNYLRNGSFEGGTTSGWVETLLTGGAIAVSTTNMDGSKSLAITSTVLANGGGYVTSNEFMPVSGGLNICVAGQIMASVINVSSKVEMIWYDAAQAQISISPYYSTTATPTAATRINTYVAAPATARFMKLRLSGGVPASGTAVGTVYFDGFIVALDHLVSVSASCSGNAATSSSCSGNAATSSSCNGHAASDVYKDAGVGGVGAMVFARPGTDGAYVASGGTYGGIYAYSVNGSLLAGYLGGTWRNIGSDTSVYDISGGVYIYQPWQRIS